VCLTIGVGDRAIGFCHVECDLAGCERLEDARGERSKPEPTFDKADGQAEAPCNLFDAGTCFDDSRECLRFVCPVHGEPLEVLREAGFAHFALFAFDHQACDLLIGSDCPTGGKRLQRCQAAPACLNFEFATRCLPNDEVLQQAACRDVSLELCIGCGIA
jgi:hypothetical protein